jgi:hypothetical protein
MAYAFKNYTRWKQFFFNVEKVAARVPYMVALGNRGA